MKPIKTGLPIAALIFLLIFLPAAASGRAYFRMSFGSTWIDGHRGLHCYPHWYGGPPGHLGSYRWLDRDRYFFHYRTPYWPRPLYSSGVRIWVEDCYPWWTCAPVVVEAPTVITERQVIIHPSPYDYKVRYDKNTAELFGKLRQKKCELLEKLRSGTKENRIEAATELAGFSYDDKVKKALEDILLSDADVQLRKQVALSLGKVKNAEFLPILEKIRVADPSEIVRKAADEAIKNIKKP